MEFLLQELDGDVFVLKAEGDLDNSNAEAFLAEVEPLIEDGMCRLIIDCSGVHTMTSNGFAVLLRLGHRARKRGGDIKLSAMHGMVAQALHTMRLDVIFDVHPDVEQARAAFGG